MNRRTMGFENQHSTSCFFFSSVCLCGSFRFNSDASFLFLSVRFFYFQCVLCCLPRLMIQLKGARPNQGRATRASVERQLKWLSWILKLVRRWRGREKKQRTTMVDRFLSSSSSSSSSSPLERVKRLNDVDQIRPMLIESLPAVNGTERATSRLSKPSSAAWQKKTDFLFFKKKRGVWRRLRE